MKVIDLLNKIANGEEVPKKIKYNGNIYEKFDYNNKYYDVKRNTRETDILSEHLANESFYNAEVEIIEENTKIEPLKIEQDTPSSNFYIKNEHGTKCGLTKHSKMIAEKVNELVREINKMKKD